MLKKDSRLGSVLIFMKVMCSYMLAKMSRSNRKNIILVGGNLGEKYEDNAAIFHQYLLQHYGEEMDIYWMYDPRTSYIKELGIVKAIALGSFKNYWLFFKADYIIYGHSLVYDIAPSIDQYISLNNKTKIVHISHGIEGFKKILIQPEDRPLMARCDYFNCASQYEKFIKQGEWGIPEDKLLVTGMARFDQFDLTYPLYQVKRILIMFTWREWLFDMTDEEFLESDYFKSTTNIIRDAQMMELISSYELEIKIVLHPFMKRFENYFMFIHTKGKVEFNSFDDVSISMEIAKADMLITDYSSVAWDFLYMNKPIIFFTFDQTEYLAMRGSYLDLNTDLFGYKANTMEEVIKSLTVIINQNQLANPARNTASKYLDFFDQQNCARLSQAIFRT